MSYSYSTDEESFHGQFETREEAAEAGFADLKDEIDEAGERPSMIIWTGENATPNRPIYADEVIDDVCERTTEEAGEWADKWLTKMSRLPKDVISELQTELQKTWDRWEENYSLQPDWYNVKNVEQHTKGDA